VLGNRVGWIARIAVTWALVAAVVGGGGPVGAAVVAPIQPGANIGDFSPQSCIDPNVCIGCTLNFVFSDAADRLFIGTAGHCTTHVGQQIVLVGDGSTIGEVTFRETGAYASDLEVLMDPVGWAGYVTNDIDFALIAIDPERYSEVSPAVRGWGGPTGVAEPSETEAGQLILQFGQGHGIRDTPLQARQGVLIDHDEEMFEFAMPVSGGDSGSPVIHAATGKALGHVHGFHNGSSLPRILRVLAEAGYDLEIVTAEFIGDGAS